MYFNFLAPLFICMTFMPALLKVYVVPDYVGEEMWRVLRVVSIVIAIMVKTLTFREELQYHFNESYFYVQKLMTEINEKLFRYIRLRMQANFLETWFNVFQQMSMMTIPMLLLFCYVHRIVSFYTTPQQQFDFSHLYPQQTPARDAFGNEVPFRLDTSDTQTLTKVL